MLFRSFLVVAAPELFILTNSRCGSAPAFYTAHFLLRQRPGFLYCPFIAAAAPGLFILTNSRCRSTPAFNTAHFSLRQRHGFLYCPIIVAAAPCFLYCPFLVAAAPTLFILTNSCCGSTPASFTAHFSLRRRPTFYTDRKSTRLNSSHPSLARMPSSA